MRFYGRSVRSAVGATTVVIRRRDVVRGLVLLVVGVHPFGVHLGFLAFLAKEIIE